MSVPITHRILGPNEPIRRYPSVGRCIYCDRTPPAVRLTDEHIIADGLGGNLLLQDASCLDCARATGRAEQHVLRGMFGQPRSALSIRSRKRHSPQPPASVESLLGFIPDDLKDAKDAPFVSGMPPFLGMIVSDLPPGILRGAPRDEKWTGHPYAVAPSDYNERTIATLRDPGPYRFGFRVHPGILGQVAAKTAHAFAVAKLGLRGFAPFLTDYIRAHKPLFDGYYIALLPTMTESEALHEITIRLEFAPQITVLGTTYQKVYVVHFRLFARLFAPEFIVVVGKPVSI